jgi:hypothetical protein
MVAMTLVATILGPSVANAAGSLLDSRSDTAFFAETTRLLASFPTLESVVPMPQNINPFNRQRVRLNCVVHVIKRNSPAKGAKGAFSAKLVVMNNTTDTFDTVALGSGKFKANSDGQAAFGLEIPTKLFAEGFKAGDISAWSHTNVDFTKRRGTYALLTCELTARK